MDLFDYRVSVRKSDPSTSKDAAASMKSIASKQHMDIIQVMRELRRPMAAEEIGSALGYPIWRRMKELQDGGLIRRTEFQHTNASGRKAFKYEIR